MASEAQAEFADHKAQLVGARQMWFARLLACLRQKQRN